MNVNVILGNFSPIDLEQYRFIEEIQKTGKTYICLSEDENISFENRLLAMNEAVSHLNVEIINELTENVVDHIERYFEGICTECNFTFYVPLNKLNETNELLDLFEVSYEVKVNPYKGFNIKALSLEEARRKTPLSDETIEKVKKDFKKTTPLSDGETEEEKFEICRAARDINIEKATKKNFETASYEENFIKNYIKQFVLNWNTEPNWRIALSSAIAHANLIKRGLPFEMARAILRATAGDDGHGNATLNADVNGEMEEIVQNAIYAEMKKENEKSSEERLTMLRTWWIEKLIYRYSQEPDKFILVNLCDDKSKEIVGVEASRNLGFCSQGNRYDGMVKKFLDGWKNPKCKVFAKKSDMEAMANSIEDFTKSNAVKDKVLLFIKPSKPNGNLKINICRNNDSDRLLRRMGFNTEEKACGWHSSGASIYIKKGVDIDNCKNVFYLKSNAGDEYEADVAQDTRLVFMDQENVEPDEKTFLKNGGMPFISDGNNFTVDEKGNYITRNGWKLSAALKGLMDRADFYLHSEKHPEDCHVSLKELKNSYSQFGFHYLDSEKPFEKEAVPILIEGDKLVLNPYYITGEGSEITDLANLKKNPVVPKFIEGDGDTPDYIAIHAGGNVFKSKIDLGACVKDVDMEEKLMETYKPLRIADVLLIETTPDETGNYKYLPISIKNDSDTLAQIGFANVKYEDVLKLVNQNFKYTGDEGNKSKIISKIVTEYVYACTKSKKSDKVKWDKGTVWCVNEDFLKGKSDNIITEDESKQVPINDKMIQDLLGESGRTVNQRIDGKGVQALFDHHVLLNMVKLGRKFGYIKKCKDEPINEDSFYERLNTGDLQVSRIHFTNKSNGDRENTNSIQITVHVKLGDNAKIKSFIVFIGSDRATSKNSMMKVMTHENKIFDISSRIVNLLS